MSPPLKHGKINRVCSENILTLQFPLVKGKLIFCEVKFLKVVRSESGWAIIWAFGNRAGPCSKSAQGRGKLCGGDLRRDEE